MRERRGTYQRKGPRTSPARRVVRGEDGSITLTQLPEPAPAPEPVPQAPSLEEDMMTVLADHEARLTAVEEGVTL